MGSKMNFKDQWHIEVREERSA